VPEVLAHSWMQGEMATAEEIADEFALRNEKVKAAIDQEKQEKLAQKQQFNAEK
jgi:hypothetical protein